MNQDKLTEILTEEPLGDDDIKKYLPDAKVMRYSQLSSYQDINSLLPNKYDYCILLYEDSPNKGHWVAVLKYDDTIEFFDSYGGAPDTQLKWNSPSVNKKLDQKPFLTNLLDTTPLNVIYNPVKYQGEGSDINTCGRHCVFRIINLIEKDRNLKNYYDLMELVKKETKSSYDDIVANLINVI